MLRQLNLVFAIHNIIIFKLLMDIMLLDILLMQLVVHNVAVEVHVAGLGLVFGLGACSNLVKLLVCLHVRLFNTITDFVLIVLFLILMLMKL